MATSSICITSIPGNFSTFRVCIDLPICFSALTFCFDLSSNHFVSANVLVVPALTLFPGSSMSEASLGHSHL